MANFEEVFFKTASKGEKEETIKAIKELRESLTQNLEEGHFLENSEEADPACWE